MEEGENHQGAGQGEVAAFTLFVILPWEDVCSLRGLPDGATVSHVRARLELEAGLPCHIYRLTCSKGELLGDNKRLLLGETAWDGYVVRATLYESWEDLYTALRQGRVDYVCKHGAVAPARTNGLEPAEKAKIKDTVADRGQVALFIAAFMGDVRMCRMLLDEGVPLESRTGYGRTPVFAAVSRDNESLMALFLSLGAELDVTDSFGETPLEVARRFMAKQCVRRIRTALLNIRGSTPQSRPNSRAETRPPSQMTSPESREARAKSPLARRPAMRRPVLPSTSTAIVNGQNCKANGEAGGDKFVWDVGTARPPSGVQLRVALQKPASATVRQVPVRTGSARSSVTWQDTNGSRKCEGLSVTPTTPTKSQQVVQAKPKSILVANAASLKKNSDSHIASAFIHVPVERAPSVGGSQMSVASAPGTMGGVGGPGSRPPSDTRSVESAPTLCGDAGSERSLERKRVGFSDDFQGSRSEADAVIRPPQRRSGRTRLLVSRTRQNESWKTMKRRIKMAAGQRRAAGEAAKAGTAEKASGRRETFEEWLHRKRMEAMHDSSQSEEEEEDDDSDDEANTRAFNEWLQAVKERPYLRPQTVTPADLYRQKSRPLKGLVAINARLDVPPGADPESYMTAYRDWVKSRKKEGSAPEDVSIEEEKRRLEERRRRLLVMAASYEDWLEHTEERKRLMQRILAADKEDLTRLEQERLKQRAPSQISFPQWRDKAAKKEASGSARKKQVRTQAEKDKQELEQWRQQYRLSHQDWLRLKGQEGKDGKRVETAVGTSTSTTSSSSHASVPSAARSSPARSALSPSPSALRTRNGPRVATPTSQKGRGGEGSREGSEAFQAWSQQKHRAEVARLEAQIRRERELLAAARQRRTPTVTQC